MVIFNNSEQDNLTSIDGPFMYLAVIIQSLIFIYINTDLPVQLTQDRQLYILNSIHLYMYMYSNHFFYSGV